MGPGDEPNTMPPLVRDRSPIPQSEPNATGRRISRGPYQHTISSIILYMLLYLYGPHDAGAWSQRGTVPSRRTLIRVFGIVLRIEESVSQ
jgi:hypothetical protein